MCRKLHYNIDAPPDENNTMDPINGSNGPSLGVAGGEVWFRTFMQMDGGLISAASDDHRARRSIVDQLRDHSAEAGRDPVISDILVRVTSSGSRPGPPVLPSHRCSIRCDPIIGRIDRNISIPLYAAGGCMFNSTTKDISSVLLIFNHIPSFGV